MNVKAVLGSMLAALVLIAFGEFAAERMIPRASKWTRLVMRAVFMGVEISCVGILFGFVVVSVRLSDPGYFVGALLCMFIFASVLWSMSDSTESFGSIYLVIRWAVPVIGTFGLAFWGGISLDIALGFGLGTMFLNLVSDTILGSFDAPAKKAVL